MKILKRREHKPKKKVFRCEYCHSVFEANENEYRARVAGLRTRYYETTCPVCGYDVVKIPLL